MKRFLIVVEGEADKKFLIKDANRNYGIPNTGIWMRSIWSR